MQEMEGRISDLKTLRVVIEADASPLQKATKEATASTKNMVREVDKNTKGVFSSPIKRETDSSIRMIKDLVGKFKNAWKGLDAGALGKNLGISEYVKEAQLAAGIRVYTDEYAKVCDDLERAEHALNNFLETKKDLAAAGIDEEDRRWDSICEKIYYAERAVWSYSQAKGELESRGADTSLLTGLANQSTIATNVATLKVMFDSATKNARALSSEIGTILGKIPILGRVVKNAAYIGSHAFADFKPEIQKCSGAFAALLARFTNGIPIIRHFTNEHKRSNESLSSGVKNVLRYTFGIRSLFTLLSKVRSAIGEGVNNLVQYDDTTNKSISLLVSSLIQLKNALAVAFAPIVNYVAPVLNSFIQLLVKATNTVGQFFASLTGQSYVIQATEVNKDYASSLTGSANSANKAAEANEALKRSLLGFDQLNMLTDYSSNSDASSKDSSTNPDISFTTTSIEGNVSDLVKKIKGAWANADFTEIGEMLGNKVTDALRSVNWDEIQEVAGKVASSFSTFLNGFISPDLFGAVGMTIAQSLNTAVQTALIFAGKFDFGNWGKSIAAGINEFFETFDFVAFAETLNQWIDGIKESITSCLKAIKWKDILARTGDFLGALELDTVEVIIGAFIIKNTGIGIVTKFAKAVGTCLLGGFTLQEVMLTIGSFVLTGSEAFVVVADKILNWIWKKIDEFLPDWWSEVLVTISNGLGLGVVIGGIFAGPGGTIAGAIIGSITGALVAFDIDWGSVIENVFGQLFNFDFSERCFELARNFFEEARNAFDSEDWSSFGIHIVSGICSGIAGAISFVFQPFINLYNAVKEAICSAFGIHSPAEKMKPYGSYILLGIVEGFTNSFGKMELAFLDFFQNTVKPWFTSKKWKSYLGSIKDALNEKWKDAKKWWDGKDSLSKVTTKVESIKARISEAWSTARSWWNTKAGLPTVMVSVSNIKNTLSEAYNSAKTWAKSNFKFSFRVEYTTSNLGVVKKAIVEALGLQGWPSFKFYANGGFPSVGEMFIANENGPEMIGRMGNKSVVANNNQITEGIRAAVVDGMMQVFASQKSAGSNQPYVINLVVKTEDNEVLARAVEKGNMSRDWRYNPSTA